MLCWVERNVFKIVLFVSAISFVIYTGRLLNRLYGEQKEKRSFSCKECTSWQEIDKTVFSWQENLLVLYLARTGLIKYLEAINMSC